MANALCAIIKIFSGRFAAVREISHIIILAFLLLSRSNFAQQPSVETLTLEQAIERAVRDNNALRNFSLDEQKIEDDIVNTKALRYPQFNINVLGSYQLVPLTFTFKEGQFGNFPIIGSVPSEDVKISTPRKPTAIVIAQAQQPISQLYRINLGIRQLKVKRGLSEETTRAQRIVVIDQVKQAYFGILRNQASISTLGEAEKAVQELVRVTENLFNYGTVLQGDLLDAKTRLLKVQADASNLQSLLATQKEQLNLLLGRDILTPFDVAEVPPPTILEIDLSEARQRALLQRPEIKQSELGIQLANLQVRVRKAERIPDLGIAVNYFSPQNYNPIVPKNFATLGVALNWDPFDYGRKNRAVEASRRDVQKAENTAVDAKNQILLDVGDKFRKLEQSRQQMKVARSAQETARENLRVVTNRYQLQTATMVEVLQSQVSLAEANNQYQQALLGFWSAKSAFEKALSEEK